MLPFSFFRGRSSVMFRRAPKSFLRPPALRRAPKFFLRPARMQPARRACRLSGQGKRRTKLCLFGAPSDKIPTFRQSIRRFPLSSRNSPALLLPEYVKNILLRSGFCPVPFSSPPACSPSTPAHRSLSCAPPRPRRSQFARTPAARRSLSCAPPACSPCAALASCRDRGRGGQNAVFSAHPPTKIRLFGNPYGDFLCLPAIRRPAPRPRSLLLPARRACRLSGQGERRTKRCLFGAPSDKIPTFRQSIRRFPLSSRNSPPPHPVRAACFCPRSAPRWFFLFFLRKAEKPCPTFSETVDSSGEFSSICGHISY